MSGLQTKVNATKYAARLRARLAEVIKKRQRALKTYKTDVMKWQKDIASWVEGEGFARARNLKAKKDERDYDRRTLGFDPYAFFSGCPKPPKYPDDKLIREIRAMLRQLAITGQQTIHLYTSDVEHIFGDPETADEIE